MQRCEQNSLKTSEQQHNLSLIINYIYFIHPSREETWTFRVPSKKATIILNWVTSQQVDFTCGVAAVKHRSWRILRWQSWSLLMCNEVGASRDRWLTRQDEKHNKIKVMYYSIWTISVILMQSKSHSGLLGTCCSLGLLNLRDIILKKWGFLSKKDETLDLEMAYS